MNATPTLRRRTNAERSSTTRARLLNATLECLDELGFAGTSTTEVGDRAGVSRGAQLHHYPTKHQLVTAAIEHLLEQRLAQFRAGFARQGITDNDDLEARVGAAVALLWSLTRGATFYAWLELLVASRTDPALRRAMRDIAKKFEAGVAQAFREAFPELGDSPAIEVAPWFTLAACQGFALDQILDPREPRIPLGVQILTTMGARAFKRAKEGR